MKAEHKQVVGNRIDNNIDILYRAKTKKIYKRVDTFYEEIISVKMAIEHTTVKWSWKSIK